MKIAFYLASAILASTPAIADDTANAFSGYGELYFGQMWISGGGGNGSINATGGAVRLNYSFNDRWNAQGDFTVDHIFKGGDSITNLRGAGHVYWRDPQSYAVGGFMTYERFLNNGYTNPLYNFSGGIEGQAYLGDWTLYGQASYGQLRSTAGPGHVSNIVGRVEARYYRTDNLRFDGGIALTSLRFSDENQNTVSPYLQANYRFDQHPVTVFARYQGDFFNGDGADHKITAGLRFSFGSTSLKSEERSGAAMDTFRLGFPFAGG